MTDSSTRKFTIHRRKLHDILKCYPNVMACGFGVKTTDGQTSDEQCITIFVSEKLAKAQLKGSEVIPKSIKQHRQSISTDVIKLGDFRRQSAPENYPFGECLSDTVRNGTRSAYVATDNGIMALTCSHVVAGNDGNPFTTAPINSFDWSDNSWKSFGLSDRAVYQAGAGNPYDFGYLDAALVRISPEVIPSLPIAQVPRFFFLPNLLDDIRRLPGTLVSGFGIASGVCQGVIQAVLVSRIDGGRFAADLVIASQSPSGLTREGDSGMLWQDQNGLILGQHALGQNAPPGQGSQLAIASFIHRIRDKLQINAFL